MYNNNSSYDDVINNFNQMNNKNKKKPKKTINWRKRLIILSVILGVLVIGGAIYYGVTWIIDYLAKENPLVVNEFDIIIINNVNDDSRKVRVNTLSTIENLIPEEIENYEFISWVDENDRFILDTANFSPNQTIKAIYQSLHDIYTFNSWEDSSQKHKIVLGSGRAFSDSISITEKKVTSEDNNIKYEYTVKGLKPTAGETYYLEIFNADGSINSITMYKFGVDNNLNVQFLLNVPTVFKASCTYRIQGKQLIDNNEGAVSIASKTIETAESNTLYEYTLTPLKAGKVEIKSAAVANSSGNVNYNSFYVFVSNIDNYLVMECDRYNVGYSQGIVIYSR